jgi:exopolyphosphatase/guanosine-5'-triphosphate,3'-diphosphate pyrophosphatase
MTPRGSSLGAFLARFGLNLGRMPPGLAADESVVAVFDIGSNSGRVVVYRGGAGGHLRILASSRASLRLIRDLDAEGTLSTEAQERLLTALRDFMAVARGAGAQQLMAVATSAIRDARNGPDLIARIRTELGLEVQTLSGEEEARFGFLGAVRSLPVSHGALFDVGGGSMQVTRFRARRVTSAVSLPLGSLRLSDDFLKSDPPTAGEVRRLREHVRKLLKEAGIRPLAAGEDLVGTGGTIRNIAKIDRRSRDYPVPRLHGYVMSRSSVGDVVEEVSCRRLRKRDGIAGLNEDRGDSIVGGSLAIHTLMQTLEAEEVWVSGQGIRDGLAVHLTTGSDVLPEPAVVRAASIEALIRRFDGWDKMQCDRRVALVIALLRALEPRAAVEIREALQQAASILDIGRSVGFFDRHQHAAEVVLATDLEGFSHRAVALLSAITLAAGGEDMKPKSYAPLLTRDDREPVRRAGVVLALADDLEERCLPGVPLELTCEVTRSAAKVRLPPLLGWRPRALDHRFEEAFGRKLVVTPG